MPRNINLDGQNGGVIREDRNAGGTIKPGHLLFTAADNDLEVHGTAGGNAEVMFALEAVGVEPAAGVEQIDHPYAAGDRVRHVYARRGARINAWLADGTNVNEGDPLESAGAGELRLHTAPSQAVDEGGTATYTIAQNTRAIVAYADVDGVTSGAAVRLVVRCA